MSDASEEAGSLKRGPEFTHSTNGHLSNGQMPEWEPQGVDQIRKLLFGNQMVDYERRFSKLEERFAQRFRDMEIETTRSLNAFEANSKRQIETLGNLLREEQQARVDGEREIERSLKEQILALEKRVRSLTDQLVQFERDIGDRLVLEAQAMREEIKRKNVELQGVIDSMFAELNGVKADRNLLSGLFVEVAKCINHDPNALSLGSDGLEPHRNSSGT
jgi:hypothetical protein